MPKLFDSVKRIGRKIGLNDDQGYGIAVFLALIIIAVVVAGYFVSAALNPPKGYSTIHLLDVNGKAVDYPDNLVVGQNSTVWVTVENHYPDAVSFRVEVKVTQILPSIYPLDIQPTLVFDTGLIAPQENWRNLVSLTHSDPGSYAIVYELYKFSGDVAEFTHNYCILNIEVKE